MENYCLILLRENVDRLPAIVTGTNVEQLLGVPKLGFGTGQEQTNAVLTCLKEWNLQTRFVGSASALSQQNWAL